MSEDHPNELSRRKFLETAIGTAAAIGIGVACGGADGDGHSSTTGGVGGLGGASTKGGTSATSGSPGTGSPGTGSPGSGSTVGGSIGTGGESATGGTTISTGARSTTGGTTGKGGASSAGGSTGKGGASSAGASSATGGNTASGGTNASGGNTGKGGTSSSGASSTTGGNTASGGTSSSGGSIASGGTTSSTTLPTGSALVGIVRNSSVVNATKQAIAMIGGFPNVTGKRVLLKPNVNTGDPTPFSTNPDIARAVIELCKAGGASRVVIADRSYTPVSTTAALAKAGLTAVAQELGVETLDLDGTPATAVKPSGANNWPATFRMYNLALTGVDVVINLCCCKNHNSSANFTASLKNWVGLLHTGDRNTAHGNIGSRIPELHLAVRESLIVMDATNVVLTLGPNPASGQATASPGLVVATRDNVACDVTCLAILKHYLAKGGISNSRITGSTCWAQPQIQRAVAMGLWITKASQYNYGESGVTEMAELLKYINA